MYVMISIVFVSNGSNGLCMSINIIDHLRVIFDYWDHEKLRYINSLFSSTFLLANL